MVDYVVDVQMMAEALAGIFTGGIIAIVVLVVLLFIATWRPTSL